MTTAARPEGPAAMVAYRDLQLALAETKLTFPESTFSDTAGGELRTDLGRVGIRTAAMPARVRKAAR
ncbi:hypothetical protein GCM10010211_63940 [Streptomyces albospinus]|uniref:Uncharacterized protein n=1 Tax=Streptomyces albospinus TaxID=285515 RepID=A0ABQ2VIF8_9ACTN|nr:hypothetical protein [Streptomyces albospinus]GGU88673.1 hypothetical protein GCM10010211_63940 [Streptomyces albospinus]